MAWQGPRPTSDLVSNNLGDLSVLKQPAVKVGSCDFCTRTGHRVVWVLNGNRTSVRLCEECMEKLREQTS